MELIIKLPSEKNKNGMHIYYGIFQCPNPICNKQVKRQVSNGKRQKSCGCLKYSEERNRKVSNSNKGHIVTEETRGKIRGSNKDRIVSEETKQKIREKRKNQIFTEETRQLMKENHKGMLGKNHTEDTRLKLKKYKGELASNWQDGISFEIYPQEFKQIKKQILDRDNCVCQDPNCKHLSDLLDCHHIDYNKKNNDPENIITLCRSCHGKSNFNRDYWIQFYQNIMEDLCRMKM